MDESQSNPINISNSKGIKDTRRISLNENSFGNLKTPISLIMKEIQSQRKVLLDHKKVITTERRGSVLRVITTERTSSVLKNMTTEGKGSVQRTQATESISSVPRAKATKVRGSVPQMTKNKSVTQDLKSIKLLSLTSLILILLIPLNLILNPILFILKIQNLQQI